MLPTKSSSCTRPRASPARLAKVFRGASPNGALKTRVQCGLGGKHLVVAKTPRDGSLHWHPWSRAHRSEQTTGTPHPSSMCEAKHSLATRHLHESSRSRPHKQESDKMSKTSRRCGKQICASLVAIATLCTFADAIGRSEAAGQPVPLRRWNFNPEEHSFARCDVEAMPGTSLSAGERCQIASLSARCSAADDCLVACIATTQARSVGGGCWHICFATVHDLSEWKAPKGFEECKSLPGWHEGG